MSRMIRALFVLIAVGTASVLVMAQPSPGAPVVYRVTFPEPEHHWMQVDMTVTGLGTQPLQARMSRSSPGRYAVHEFAKNMFWFEAVDGKGKALSFTRPNVDEWDVAGHDGTVKVDLQDLRRPRRRDVLRRGHDARASRTCRRRSCGRSGAIHNRLSSRSCRRRISSGRSRRSSIRRPIRGSSRRRTSSTTWTARRSCRTSR